MTNATPNATLNAPTPTESAKLIHDDRYVWKGHGTPEDMRNPNMWESYCRLKIWQLSDQRKLILFTDLLQEDSGTSITNSAERVITLVAKDFQIENPETALWLEHYPERIPGTKDPIFKETIAQIICQWSHSDREGNKASRPTWQHITRAELERVLKQFI